MNNPIGKVGLAVAHAETDFYPHVSGQKVPVAISCSKVRIDVACLDDHEVDSPHVIIKFVAISGNPPNLLNCTIREDNGHPLAVISRNGNILGYLGVNSIEFEKLTGKSLADNRADSQDS